ncbi:hypothetical protein B0H14DRAFT_2592016 [Mycena olivaceomarginata]|nr:hypothetical protein B0H14DRAFT_2592016 [Mycena olivaceomarginata]
MNGNLKGNHGLTSESKGDEQPYPRMVEGEDYNFLRFATALKIIVGRTFRIDRLDYVKTRLRDYLLNFLEIYGAESIMPNHHWAVHVPDQLLDYAFLTERLNKILKNINSNNWTGGELEVSMMREFHRKSAVDSALRRLLTSAGTSTTAESEFIEWLVGQSTNIEAIGTIQDASHSGQALCIDQVAQ